jgi:large subunit ribosomal protein L15
MRLHELKPAAGSHRDRKRLGRGNASGQGTTAGKGTKGQKARSGGVKAGFRGMSSRSQRMAKRRGFTNIFKVPYQIVNVDRLAHFEAGTTISPETLQAAGLVSGSAPVKILGDGELSVALNVVDIKLSSTARAKIEAAGGSVTEKISEKSQAVSATAAPVMIATSEGSAPMQEATEALAPEAPTPAETAETEE